MFERTKIVTIPSIGNIEISHLILLNFELVVNAVFLENVPRDAIVSSVRTAQNEFSNRRWGEKNLPSLATHRLKPCMANYWCRMQHDKHRNERSSGNSQRSLKVVCKIATGGSGSSELQTHNLHKRRDPRMSFMTKYPTTKEYLDIEHVQNGDNHQADINCRTDRRLMLLYLYSTHFSFLWIKIKRTSEVYFKIKLSTNDDQIMAKSTGFGFETRSEAKTSAVATLVEWYERTCTLRAKLIKYEVSSIFSMVK